MKRRTRALALAALLALWLGQFSADFVYWPDCDDVNWLNYWMQACWALP